MHPIEGHNSEVEDPNAIPEDEGMGFNPRAQEQLDECCSDYESTLRQTAIVCATNDDCDTVQAKHVRAARLAVSRMSPPDGGIGMNSLLGGLFFAVALAIPDTTSFCFGTTNDGHLWTLAKVFVGLFMFAGISFSVRAFLISLGPHKPKWVVYVCKKLDFFHQSKK